MLKRHSFTAILLITISPVSNAQGKFIPYNDSNIYYEGRIKDTAGTAELSWPGTSATILFKGKIISAILKDADTANYYTM
ncbi:MAG: hypothetical protein M3Z92_04720 [Bacteroidota bacterium]|nr:hypothetical protein [Bacteroidota bacterium]